MAEAAAAPDIIDLEDLGAEKAGHNAEPDKKPEAKPNSPRARADRKWFGKQTAPASGSHGTITFDRADFVHGATTGKNGRIEQGNAVNLERRRPENEGTVTIHAETVDRYATTLETTIKTINNSLNETERNALLSDPNHRSLKLLMDLLADQQTDAKGKPVATPENRDKIMDFLRTPKGWATTTMLMDQQVLWTQLARGAHSTVESARANRAGPRGWEADHAVAYNRIPTARNVAKEGLSYAVKGLQTLGYLTGGRGTELHQLKTDFDIINAVKNGATDSDKARMKMIGIDIDRIDTSTGVVRYTDKEYNPDIDRIDIQAGNALAARNDFYNQLGFAKPPEWVFGTRVNRGKGITFLSDHLGDKTKQAEGLPIYFHMEAMAEAADLNSRNPGASDAERIYNLAQGEEKVMVRYLEGLLKIRDAEATQEKEAASLQALQDKKAEILKDPGKYHEAKLKEIQKRKDAAVKGQETAEKKKTELVDPLPAREVQVATQEAALAKEFRITVGSDGDFEAALDTREKAFSDSIEKYEKDLGRLDGQKAKALKARLDAIRADNNENYKKVADAITAASTHGVKTLNAPEVKGVEPFVTGAQTEVDTIFGRRIAHLEAELLEAQNKLKSFREKRSAYDTAVSSHNEGATTIAARYPGQLKTSLEGYEKFIPPAGTVSLLRKQPTPAEIRTLSVEDLAARLASGTPEEKIQFALAAKAEAAAREKEREKPIPKYQTDAIADLARYTRLTPDEIVIGRLGDIRGLLSASTTGGSGLSDAEARTLILAAQAGAQGQLRNRFAARTDIEIVYFKEQVKGEDKNIEEISDPKKVIVEIDSAMIAMTNQDGIFERASGLTDPLQREAMDKLLDTTKIDPADSTYSEAERNKTDLQKGWLEMMYLIDPELPNKLNRNELVDAYYRILPPDKLAELLRDNLPITPPAGPPNLDRVLTRVMTRYYANRLSGIDLQQASKVIINHIRDHALAK